MGDIRCLPKKTSFLKNKEHQFFDFLHNSRNRTYLCVPGTNLKEKMKTLLFIGVLVAVISWSSAFKCYGSDKEDPFYGPVCTVPGKTLDEKACKKIECPYDACFRVSETSVGGEITTKMGCGAKEDLLIGCRVSYLEPAPDIKTWTCRCKKALCNGADGTSYTHLIITVIVGAIFFH